MINYADFTRYRAAEFIQFLSNALDIVDSNDPVTLNLQAQRDALFASHTALAEEYRPATASEVTAELVALDERRDQAISGISQFLRAHQNHFDPSKVAAANRLLEDLARHGANPARLRYQLQTGILKTIVGDWESDDTLVDAIQDLGLGDWLAELRTANDTFDTKYVQRARETAGDPSQVAALRAQCTEDWDSLEAHLTAHATLTPSAAYTSLVNELNNLITTYNQAAEGRESGEGESSDDSESPA
jgi:hypothetical protein